MPLYVWLGLRLTFADTRTRGPLGFLLVMSALICFIIVGALGAQSVVRIDNGIDAWRKVVTDRSQGPEDTGLWLVGSDAQPTGFGRELTLVTIVSTEPGIGLEVPGLETLPSSGAILVSPAVRSSGPDMRAAFGEYLGGVGAAGIVAGPVLPDSMLRTADEFVAVRFVRETGAEPAPEWKPLRPGSTTEPTTGASVVLVVLLATFFAAGTLLMTVAARFLQQNSPNLAAVRLLGASRTGMVAVSLVPVVVVAMLGAGLGALVFAIAREGATKAAPRTISFVANRASTSVTGVVLVIAAVGAIVTLMGVAAIVVVTRDSLSALRWADKGKARPPVGRLLLLVVGGALLAVDTESTTGALMWWSGVALFLIGILGLGRMVVALLAERRWSRPEHMLGFGILAGSTREAKLLYTPAVSVLFTCALLVPLSAGFVYQDELAELAYADVIVSDPHGGIGRLTYVEQALARGAPGIEIGLVSNATAEVAPVGSPQTTYRHSLWVGGCSDLRLFLGDSTLECEQGVVYYPPGLGPPAESAEGKGVDGGPTLGGKSGDWRTHDLETDLVYWVDPSWARENPEEVAVAWLAVKTAGRSVQSVVTQVTREVPGLRVEVPEEHRNTLRQEGNRLRALVLGGVGLIALTTLATYVSAAGNYLSMRTSYMEHILRLGLPRSALLISAAIVVTLPLLVGAMLVVPSGLAIGSILATGFHPVAYSGLSLATLFCSALFGLAIAGLRVWRIRAVAPARSLGSSGVGGRG